MIRIILMAITLMFPSLAFACQELVEPPAFEDSDNPADTPADTPADSSDNNSGEENNAPTELHTGVISDKPEGILHIDTKELKGLKIKQAE